MGLADPAAEEVVAEAVKVAEEAPVCTKTETGTVKAEDRLLESVTVRPPAGAAMERVTVQVVEEGATRLVLAHCKEEIAGVLAFEIVIEID